MAIDQQKLEAFMGRFVQDLGAVLHAPLVILGDRLGLYRGLKEGPATAGELARRTKTFERYVAEWLAANAASGYVEYDRASGRFSLSEEQAMALADPDSPAYLPGALLLAMSQFRDEPKLEQVFQSGKGLGWHEHDHCLFEGTEKFFRASYIGNLVASWLPALDGVVHKLEQGARVADIGCGHGASTVLMAQAYPKSTFVGYDYHGASIERARRAAAEAGVSERASFEIAPAKEYPGNGYDLVATFDCLHDMGDPEGAARHILKSLAPDGTWMIVEPFAHDELEHNLNPVGRVYYSASTFICTPGSRAQEVGLALGAQAGQKRLEAIARAAGFTRFRRATETPFNLVLEARP
jgi:2-polyprenyl-3-methyl-5-hydroxy-6-metoxy-1,4-benzoquinol methylase